MQSVSEPRSRSGLLRFPIVKTLSVLWAHRQSSRIYLMYWYPSLPPSPSECHMTGLSAEPEHLARSGGTVHHRLTKASHHLLSDLEQNWYSWHAGLKTKAWNYAPNRQHACGVMAWYIFEVTIYLNCSCSDIAGSKWSNIEMLYIATVPIGNICYFRGCFVCTPFPNFDQETSVNVTCHPFYI